MLVAFSVAIGVAVVTESGAPVPRPTTSAQGGGLEVGRPDAPVPVVLYEDYQCSHCRTFEETSGPELDRLVEEGLVRIEHRLVPFLGQDSAAAAAAAGCAADAGVFEPFHELLFDAQAAGGFPPDTLLELGRRAGAGPAFEDCVQDQRYLPWASQAGSDAAAAGVDSTPTVLVDGRELVDRSPAGIAAAVAAAR